MSKTEEITKHLTGRPLDVTVIDETTPIKKDWFNHAPEDMREDET